MAVSAGKQYLKTDYYMKDPVFDKDNGVMIGGLYKDLGFSDKITAKSLRGLQKGQDAKGNQVIALKKIKNEKTGKMELKHNPGKDFSFSIDKSISLLYAANPVLKPQIENAMRSANQKMIETMIADGKVGYREHVHNKDVDVMKFHSITDINSYSIASFIQSPSRENDINIHIHNAFMNQVKDETGNIRAVCFDALFENDYLSKYLDTVAKNEFYQVLSAQTGINFMKITDTDRNTNITKLHNVEQTTLDKFSKRKTEMNKYIDKNGLNNDAKSRQKANLMTRKEKEIDITAEQLYQKVEPHFTEINTFQEKEYQHRNVKDVTLETIKAESEKEVFTNFYKLVAEVLKENRDYSLETVKNAIDELVKDGTIVKRDFESSAMKFKGIKNVNNVQYATSEMVQIEKDFQIVVQEGKGESFKIDENELAETLTTIQNDLKPKYGENFGYSLEQLGLIHSVFTIDDKFIAATGRAGVGKTVSYEGIKKVADASGIKVYGFANAGSQGSTLQKKANINSSTIKSFTTNTLKKNDVEKVDGKILVTLDEASMVGIKDLWDFKQALDLKFSDYKLVVVGDKYQNLSISAGLGFTNLIDKTDTVNKTMLKDIQRQKNQELKSAILNFYKQFETDKKIDGKSIFETLQNKGFLQLTNKPIESKPMTNENDKENEKEKELKNDLKTEITDKYMDFVNKDGIDQTKIVVRSNYAKDIFDTSIHKALQEAKKLGKDEFSSQSYRKVNVDDVAKLRAETFKTGDIVSLKKNEKSIITSTDKLNDTISIKDIKYVTIDELIDKKAFENPAQLKEGGLITLAGKDYKIEECNADKTVFKFLGKERVISLRDKEQTEQLQLFKKIDVKFSQNERVEITDNIKVSTDKEVFDKTTVFFIDKDNKVSNKNLSEKEYEKLHKDVKLKKFGDDLLKGVHDFFDPTQKSVNLDYAINKGFANIDKSINKFLKNHKNKKAGKKYQKKKDRTEIVKDKNGNKMIKEIITTDKGTFVFLRHFKKEKIELKNREQLTLINIDKVNNKFTFESNLNGKITLDLNKIDNLKAFETLNYAYSSTIEASQGMDAKNVIGVELEKFQNANQFLVLFSRGVENVVSYYKINDFNDEKGLKAEMRRAYDKFSMRQEKTTSIETPKNDLDLENEILKSKEPIQDKKLSDKEIKEFSEKSLTQIDYNYITVVNDDVRLLIVKNKDNKYDVVKVTKQDNATYSKNYKVEVIDKNMKLEHAINKVANIFERESTALSQSMLFTKNDKATDRQAFRLDKIIKESGNRGLENLKKYADNKLDASSSINYALIFSYNKDARSLLTGTDSKIETGARTQKEQQAPPRAQKEQEDVSRGLSM